MQPVSHPSLLFYVSLDDMQEEFDSLLASVDKSSTSSEIAQSQFNLGKYFFDNSKFKDAIQPLKASLKHQNGEGFIGNSSKATTQMLLGRSLNSIKTIDGNLEYLLDATMVFYNESKKDNPTLVSISEDILQYYELLQSAKVIKSLTRRLKSMKKSEEGKVFHFTLYILLDVANAYTAEENRSAAEKLYLYVIEMSKLTGSPRNSMCATFINAYGDCLRAFERYDEAIKMFQESLSIRLEIYGDMHLSVAESHNNLGIVYSLVDNTSEAEKSLLESLRIRRELVTEDDPQTAGTLNNLAELYREKKEFTSSMLFHEASVSSYRNSLGVNHGSTRNAIGNMGVTMIQQANYGLENGESYIKSTIQYLNENNYKENHPWLMKFTTEYLLLEAQKGISNQQNKKTSDILSALKSNKLLNHSTPAMRNIATLATKQAFESSFRSGVNFKDIGNYGQAESIFTTLLDQETEKYNAKKEGDHIEKSDMLKDSKLANMCLTAQYTTIAMEQADNYRLKGDFDSADKLYDICRSIRVHLYGEVHPSVMEVLSHQGLLYSDFQYYDKSKDMFNQVHTYIKAYILVLIYCYFHNAIGTIHIGD